MRSIHGCRGSVLGFLSSDMPMMGFVTVGAKPKRKDFGCRLNGDLLNVGWSFICRKRGLFTVKMSIGEEIILSRSLISWVIRFGPGERRPARVDFSSGLILQSAT